MIRAAWIRGAPLASVHPNLFHPKPGAVTFCQGEGVSDGRKGARGLIEHLRVQQSMNDLFVARCGETNDETDFSGNSKNARCLVACLRKLFALLRRRRPRRLNCPQGAGPFATPLAHSAARDRLRQRQDDCGHPIPLRWFRYHDARCGHPHVRGQTPTYCHPQYYGLNRGQSKPPDSLPVLRPCRSDSPASVE